MVLLDGSRGLEIHAAHAAHAAACQASPARPSSGSSATIASVVIIRPAIDAAFCSAGAGDLGRVQDAELDHVAELAVGGVVAEAARTFLDLRLRMTDGSSPALVDDLAQRGFHRAQGDLDAVVLVFVDALEAGDRRHGTDQGDAAARDHAFLDGRTGRVQGVFDAGLLFLHLDFGARHRP